MSRRGRKSGYKNFSVAEQLLLCNILDDIQPLGKDMWERVATTYNDRRPRGTPERDYDSLRRKFRNLVAKKKPSGINGRIPESLKPVALAHEIHMLIEQKASVFEGFDGKDRGEDDDELTEHVRYVLNENESANANHQAADSDGSLITATDLRSSPGLAPTEEDVEVASVDDASSVETAEEADGADRSKAQNENGSHLCGTIATSQGELPVAFSQDFEDWQSDRDADATQVEDAEACARDGVETGDDSSGAAVPGRAGDCTPRSVRTARSSPRPTSTRPRSAEERYLPSFASPDGPALLRHQNNLLSDARELSLNKNLSAASNRLGGKDLRVLRDNFQEMGGRTSSSKAKRPLSDTASSTTFVSTKRYNAKKRMDEIEKRVASTETTRSASGNEIATMMAFFREKADRRTEAEDKRRREEREERRDLEKKEREERDRIRQDELVAAELRREERLQRELDAREETRARQDQEKERQAAQLAENKRQFEERLKLDRQEARERHEQMMLVLAALIPKKQ